MNNREFIKALSKKTGKSQKATEAQLSVVLKAMSDNFAKGEPVMITNFGLFSVRQKAQRTIINPVSEQRMVVPQKLNLVFKPIDALKSKYKAENK